MTLDTVYQNKINTINNHEIWHKWVLGPRNYFFFFWGYPPEIKFRSWRVLSNNAILKYKLDLVVKKLLHVFERSIQKSRNLDLEESENPLLGNHYVHHLARLKIEPIEKCWKNVLKMAYPALGNPAGVIADILRSRCQQ